MKDYLNKDERLQMLFFKKYIDNIEEMLEGKNITKEEHKHLKTAMTWGLKGFNSKMERLNNTAIKTFWNSVRDSYVHVEDRYAMELINKRISSKLDDAYKLNRDYFKLVELIMHYNCKNCNKNHNVCEIYREFEEHYIPDIKEDLGNCRYAYNDILEKK